MSDGPGGPSSNASDGTNEGAGGIHPETPLSLVLTTLPDQQTAEALVTTLVEEGHIACGNIVPGVLSIYRWDGDVVREAEVVVLMKTVTANVRRLVERLPELHPYSVPEVVGLSVEAVHRPYGQWVTESTRK